MDMDTAARIVEGDMPYLGFSTHWRVVGDLESGKPPLVLLHGGPGSTRNYFEVLDCLADTGRAVVSYDQLGCGDSFVDGHPELWYAQTWVDELVALREHLGLDRIHLLGQSWGGMLAITYLADERPAGIASAVLSSTLPASWLWARENRRMARQLPAEQAEALLAPAQAVERARAEARAASCDPDLAARRAMRAYDDPAYQSALNTYMQMHCNDVTPGPDAPECVRRPKRGGRECYVTAWGPDELTPTGTLATWDYIDKLPSIEVPALVISGTDDLSTPLVSKTIADGLPNARWELIAGARHSCYIDAHDQYCELLASWMAEHD